MLYPRIIPVLLVHNKGLVKTLKFKDPKYVGDPINAVKIFNEKEVDEIMVIDIDASSEKREPDFKMIADLAYECRMPLCYGGGIKTTEQALKIHKLGVEKIALSSAAIENPSIVENIASKIGNQSVVVILDIKRKLVGNRYEIFTHNARKATGIDPIEFSIKMEKCGAGEIVINSIDNDGTMKGYDLYLACKIRDKINIPLTILGGAGSLDDMGQLIKEHGIIGVAAGSLFVFKGKYRAVLINYPTALEKENLLKKYFSPYWKG